MLTKIKNCQHEVPEQKTSVEPLFFVRSGYVYPYASSDRYRNAGYYGRYWSSIPYSDGTNAYLLYFGTGVAPSDYYYRYYGYSLRCLAR